MLTPTHLVAGQTSFLLATVIAGHQPTLPEALLAAAAILYRSHAAYHQWANGKLFRPPHVVTLAFSTSCYWITDIHVSPFRIFPRTNSRMAQPQFSRHDDPGRCLLVLAQPY